MINECIYVGDTPSDTLACKELGLSIAAAAWAETTNDQELFTLNPDWIFYSVEEFRNWLAKFM